jgi:hypothetical protein
LFPLLAASLLAQAPPKSIHPRVKQTVDAVSEERIAATMKKIETFGTRYVGTPGNAAARAWIASELKSYSPRLEVREDTWTVNPMPRMTGPQDVVNIVAVLPGKTRPEKQIVIASHHDTVAYLGRGGGSPSGNLSDKAPGVVDNGSGVAATMELARAMSQQEFDKTLVFAIFSAEEQGLVGATLHAQTAKAEKRQIEAVLNNDIMGSDLAGNGFRATHAIRVFSGEPMDSPSRSLARYIKEAGERYVPEMRVDAIFRADRFGRGGDTPFHQRGYAAVRFTAPAEHYQNQHSVNDNFENSSPAYTTRVTRVNAAAAASLALAPSPPQLAGLGRGATQYDAVPRWKSDPPEANLAGYALLLRATTAPYWEREIYVGKANEYTVKNFSIDEAVIGVKAYNAEGLESLAAVYATPERPARDVDGAARR